MQKILLLLFLIVICSFYQAHAQQVPTFDKNVILEEDNGGALVLDVLSANNRLFVYSSNKLLVYNNDGDSLLQTFKLTNLGKFAPVFFSSDIWVPGIKLMAYNHSDNILYIVRADLKIEAFKFDNNNNVVSLDVLVDTPVSISYMKTLHGFSILKYDEEHQRLFWVVQGRCSGLDPGHFHERASYIGIYKVKSSGQVLDRFYQHYYPGNDTANYTNAIYDVEFIDDNNDFYLARMQRVDIFNIYETLGQITVSFVESIPTTEGKIGKLLYASDIDKVIAFPYRLPFQDGIWEPDSADYGIDFYVINVNNYMFDTIPSPDRRIYDAVYLPNEEDLILCRNPVNDTNNNIVGIQDIAVYHWNGSTFTPYPDNENYLINTNGFTGNINPNTPIKMLQVSDNGVIISKKHEVVYLYKNFVNDNYTFAPKHTGENNFFFFSTKSSNNNTFVINLVNNGIVKLNSVHTYESTTKTGYPAFHIVQNEQHSKLYFFNKLNNHNTGFYIYDALYDNGNGRVETFVEVDNPIGDLIYNPYKNQVLVSENASPGNSTGVKCYNGTTGVHEESIIIPYGYCKKMFIAPNGLLYIAANMYHENNKPQLYIRDATTYEAVNGISGELVENILIPDTYFRYYAANFCYNPFNQAVYATFKPQAMALNPYTPSPESSDSLVLDTEPMAVKIGILLKLTTNIISGDTTFIYPGKVICQEPLDDTIENTNGYLFIQERDDLTVYNCDNSNKNTINGIYTDITYSAYHDKLYGIKNYRMENEGTGTKVYEIDHEANYDSIYETSGIVASCTINPYDNMLYLYHRLDDKMLGELATNLIFIDPENLNNTQIDLGDNNGNDKFYGFFPEILQKSQTPVFNPLNNKIYLPNGGHSSVSMVNFEAMEMMVLDSGINWISIPRHMGNITNQQYDPWPTNSVFVNGNFGTPYAKLSLAYNKVDETHEEEIEATFNIDEPNQWSYEYDMDSTFSYRGYKLNIFQDSTTNTLTLRGNVEDPFRPIELYGGKHNWVGYFLYREQDIFDALGITLNYLFKIEAEKWSCTYHGPYRNPGTSHQITEGWECTDEFHTIDYGEMVELTTDYLEPGYTFVWQGNGQPVDGRLRDDTEHFTYEETADYTPVFVLLDSTDNPSELATYVNDSCIGACIVLPGDTMVGILAYLNGQAGDSIIFEEWYNTKSTARKKINSYSVYNPNREQYEQRSILIGENREFYKVSFRKYDQDSFDNDMQSILADLWVYPNPSSQYFSIEYRLHRECIVNIEAYDIYGRMVAIIVNGNQLSGVQKHIWNLKGDKGQQVCSGIYTIKIIAGGETITRKVVIN